MKRRRRKMGRPTPAWKSAIGFSVAVHVIVFLCVVGVGWRYFIQNAPGTVMLIHEVMLGESEAGNELGSPNERRLSESDGGWHGVGSHWRSRTASPHPPITSAQPAARGEPMGDPVTGPAFGSASEDLGQSLQSVGEQANGSGHGTTGDPILAEIRRRIEQAKRYPAQAREQHREGKVSIRFSIQNNGQIQDLRITHSSGISSLDEAALQAVQRSTPLPYYRNTIDLSLAFRLR